MSVQNLLLPAGALLWENLLLHPLLPFPGKYFPFCWFLTILICSEGEALCGHMTCESFDALWPSVRLSV